MISVQRIIIGSLCVLLSGCGQTESDNNPGTTPTAKQEEISTPQSAPAAEARRLHVTGKIRNIDFSEEQSTLNNDRLTIRQGKEYFADASAAIVLFDNTNLSGKKFFSGDPGLATKPQIWLGIRQNGQSLPDDITIDDGYELKLKFGTANALGIPYEIYLDSSKDGTHLEGSSFATFKDIRITNQNIDLQYDSFDTLEYLANSFLKLDEQGAIVKSRFGIGYRSFGDENPKTGFVGLEYTDKSGNLSVAKVQLLKDVDGWKVVNQLTARQIPQAHPVITDIKGGARTIETLHAEHAAAIELEKFLNEKMFIELTRTTSISCYLTKNNNKASCRSVYGLIQEGETRCQSKNYLLVKDGADWKITGEILDDQKVDYTSGELVTQKPLPMHCE